MEIKQAVFAELDAVTPGHAILASNTSSLSIAEMADATLRPHKVVGFHFFYPASVMPLVEIVAGVTDEETIEAAVNFAQTIRKQPIVCEEVPGFVVNRILNSAVGEIWRAQEEQGLSIKKIDEAVGAQNVAPMGPFFLVDLLGLDTVFHVAEHLNESYGDSFYVHQGMKKLVSEGKLGAKSGGSGFYENGEPQIEGDAEPNGEELAELMSLKAIVEACLVLEEGVSTVREIDLGMMAGAGMDPRRGIFPPFTKADLTGLDVILEKLEAAEEKHGERFAPPVTLRRLVAQGRLGQKAGQGFYAYPQADEGDQTETVKLETRGDVAIAWLANGMMNAVSPQVVKDLGTVWEKVKSSGDIGAMVIASANPLVFSAGADIKAFTQMDEAGGEDLIHSGHALLRDLGQNRGLDDRGGQLTRVRRRLRGLDGLRLPDRGRVGDLRPAGDQAGDHPRVRRHAAPAAPRRPAQGAGDEPDRRCDHGARCARARARQPRRARPRAVRHRARLGAQARRPGAAGGRGDQEGQPQGRPGRGHRGREAGLRRRLPRPRTARKASRLSSASARPVEGSSEQQAARTTDAPAEPRRDSSEEAERLAGMIRESASTVVLTGAGVSVPSGIPDFRTPGTGLWENVDPMEVAHIDAFHRGHRALLALLPPALPRARREGAERRSPRARGARGARAGRGRHHPEHRSAPSRGRVSSG